MQTRKAEYERQKRDFRGASIRERKDINTRELKATSLLQTLH